MFKVIGREEGSDVKKFERKFSSLAAVQEYVKERWEGVDYINGPAEWHTDYVAYELVGCELKDLGQRRADDFYSWEWKTL